MELINQRIGLNFVVRNDRAFSLDPLVEMVPRLGACSRSSHYLDNVMRILVGAARSIETHIPQKAIYLPIAAVFMLFCLPVLTVKVYGRSEPDGFSKPLTSRCPHIRGPPQKAVEQSEVRARVSHQYSHCP